MSQREQQLLADIRRLQMENGELRANQTAKEVTKTVVVNRDVEKIVRQDTLQTVATIAELRARVSMLERELAGLGCE